MLKAYKELMPLSLSGNEAIYIKLKTYKKETLDRLSLYLWKEYIETYINEARRHEIFILLEYINYEIWERNNHANDS